MGIGEAIAKELVDQGAQVVLLSRDSGRLEAARSRLGHEDQTLALACDVLDGYVARLNRRRQSMLGADLDSLADLGGQFVVNANPAGGQ